MGREWVVPEQNLFVLCAQESVQNCLELFDDVE